MIIYSSSRRPPTVRMRSRPVWVILETGHAVRAFRLAVEEAKYEVDEERMFAELLEHLCYEEDASLAIGAFAHDQAEDHVHQDHQEHFRNLLLELGQHILTTARALKLYRGGYLHYQFDCLHGADVILGDFSAILSRVRP